MYSKSACDVKQCMCVDTEPRVCLQNVVPWQYVCTDSLALNVAQ